MTNKYQPVKPSRQMKPGFTMIEVMGAMLIMAMLFPGLAWLWQKGSIEMRKRAVAEHFITVTRGVEKYINQNHAALLAASSATNGPVISLADLRAADCLSDMTQDFNAWGQEYHITTRLTQEGDIAAAIITTGGRSVSANDSAFANVTVPETAALAKIGFIPVEPSTLVRGPYGSWEFALADFNLTGEPGHLALLTSLDSQALKQDYLYRIAVPGEPQLNAMQTTLDMTDHAIRGVGEVQYVAHSYESLANFCTAPEDEGRTFLDADKGLYLCRAGKIRVINDTGNSLAMQSATLATDGQLINKPVCPAGSATHPEIFVTPSVAAAAANATDAGKVKPMHSFQTWATNYPATNPNAPQWQVRMRVLNSDNTWIYPTPNYGRMVVFTSCVRD